MDLHDQPDPTRRANAFLRKSSNDALTASMAFDVLQRPSCALHKLCPQTMPETRFSRVVINAHREGQSSNKMNV